jgi:muconolactone delta-isomerase
MKLPIRFPSDADAIAEESARFRELSPLERVQAIGQMHRLYQFLAGSSARPEAVARSEEYEEQHRRTAIEEFIGRHG